MWQRIKNIYHLFVAIAANILYGFPGRNLTVIGVTGTDGKTTTVNLIYHILKEAGYSVSMISTVGAVIHGGQSDIGFHVTTPSPLKLQKFLKQAAEGKGKQYLVLEVTSHALDQNRVWGISFAVGVLTNITHEHLDYHKTYAKYVQAKIQLLKTSGTAIVNADDVSYQKVKYFLKKDKKVITYGAKNGQVMLKDVSIPHSIEELYNKYNALAASVAAMEVGIDKKIVQQALKSFTLPKGRNEVVYDKDFTIMIDFAHTPNAFEQLLSSIREKTRGRLIHVFGSAGARDISKRPFMGKVAAQYDDVIILTAEDPRKENIEEINQDIKKGISSFNFSIFNESKNVTLQKNKKYLFEIPNREEAIQAAIQIAQKGDVIVCTGKAHERSMNYGNGEDPWDEFKVVKAALKKRKINI